MNETCCDCDHTWGVTEAPREQVRCMPCARPRPDRDPVAYWQTRLINRAHPATWIGSVEWWDAQTTRNDLRVAVDNARYLAARSSVARECGHHQPERDKS